MGYFTETLRVAEDSELLQARQDYLDQNLARLDKHYQGLYLTVAQKLHLIRLMFGRCQQQMLQAPTSSDIDYFLHSNYSPNVELRGCEAVPLE